MGKIYTIDGKLLIGGPEVRIGDKLYPIDDRQKTVKKVMRELKKEQDELEMFDCVLKLLLGDKSFREIDDMNLPFAAHRELFEIAVAAMTGEEVETVKARFPEPEKTSD